jgi:hypothetical protein
MKNDFYMGDLYPNLGYMTTRANTIPEPQDQVVFTQRNQDQAMNNPLGVDNHAMRKHYWALLIIVATILLLGVRM